MAERYEFCSLVGFFLFLYVDVNVCLYDVVLYSLAAASHSRMEEISENIGCFCACILTCIFTHLNLVRSSCELLVHSVAQQYIRSIIHMRDRIIQD